MKRHLAVASLSLLTFSALPLSIASHTMVAEAASWQLQPKVVAVNGQVVQRTYGVVSSGTTYMPIAYLMPALAKLGYKSTWDGTTWSITAPPYTPVDLSNISASSGAGAIRLNGRIIYRVPKILLTDPSTHHPTTLMPILYVMRVLNRVGIDSAWDGTTWRITTPPPISVTVVDPAQYPTLCRGANGYPVVLLQQKLNAAGFNVGSIDGVFGPATLTAVQAFQRAHGLTPDGVVGPATWLALNRALAQRFGLPDAQATESTGASARNGGTSASSGSPVVMAWVTSAASMQSAEQQPDITEIHDDHYTAADDGTVSAVAGIANATVQLTTYAHSHHVTLYATVTNINPGTGNFDGALAHQLVSSAAARTRFRQKLVALCGQGYDGIDIDFEYVQPADESAFLSLLGCLAADLHAAGKHLSVTVPARTGDTAEPWDTAYDYSAIGNVADEVPVMTYDYNWQGGTPGAIAPLYWDQAVLNYATPRIPAAKLHLGLALYGYDWDTTAGGPATALSLGAVDTLRTQYAATPAWDSTDAVPFFMYTDTRGDAHVVYYENEASLSQKLALATQYHLGGVAIWRAGLETPAAWSAIDAWLHPVN